MTILIKGMELPKKGYKDLRIYADGSWSAYAETIPYNEFHGAAVEVPIPHGQLKDADELIKHDHQYYEYLSDEFYVLVRDIENAPTIIEAEEVQE